MKELLSELGFSEYESDVYLSLIELGEATANSISTKVKIHRRNVYDILNRLVKKGLVSSITKNNRKFYSPVNPERIISSFEEKLRIAEQLVPELVGKYSADNEQRVQVFEDKAGIKTFHEEMLRRVIRGHNLYVIGATGNVMKLLPEYFPRRAKQSQRYKKRLHVLWNHGVNSKIRKIVDPVTKISRVLPKKFFLATQFFIYGNNTAIAIWSDKSIVINIESEQITKGMMEYFKILWSISK